MAGVRKIPLRRCTGCGESKDKRTMLRILRTTEGEIVCDRTGKKNGRGAYICPREECLDRAWKNHGLARSLKTAVPPEVYETIRRELKEGGEEGKP